MIKVLFVVLTFHALAVVMLMVQPGCKSMEGQGSSVNNNQMARGAASQMAPVEEVKPRFAPTRPAVAAVKPVMEDSVSQEIAGELLKPLASSNLNAFTNKEEPMEFSAKTEEYTVKSGDSLWIIAKRKQVSINELIQLNGLNKNSTLRVGQKIQLPANQSSSMQFADTTQAIKVEGALYTVRSGDSLSVIAMRNHVSVQAIKEANNMTNSNLIAGKKIMIPGVSVAAEPSSSPKVASATQKSSVDLANAETHKVEPGESLSVIASRYKMKIADLQQMNNITDPKKLRVGQVLKVREKKSEESSQSSNGELQVAAVSSVEAQTGQQGTNEASTETDLTASAEEKKPEAAAAGQDDDDLFNLNEEIPVVTVDAAQS